MEEFGIEITGIEDCMEQLDKFPKKLVQNAFGKALTASAVPMLQALQVRTPRDTGKLASSIKSDIKISPEGGTVDCGFSGELAHVARFLEYGHRIVGHKPNLKDTGKKTEPRPFMRPSAATATEPATEAFNASIAASLEGDLI